MALCQCPFCPIEFEVRVVDLEGRGTALCTTIWSDLGAGLTTSDPSWRANYMLSDLFAPHERPVGIIRQQYESQQEESVSDSTAENKKRLVPSLHVIGDRMSVAPDSQLWKPARTALWYLRPEKELNCNSS